MRRFPFLLLDRVVEYVPQKYAVGYKNVTANDNFFTGHFPERKIMPGKMHCSFWLTKNIPARQERSPHTAGRAGTGNSVM